MTRILLLAAALLQWSVLLGELQAAGVIEFTSPRYEISALVGLASQSILLKCTPPVAGSQMEADGSLLRSGRFTPYADGGKSDLLRFQPDGHLDSVLDTEFANSRTAAFLNGPGAMAFQSCKNPSVQCHRKE